MKSRIVYILICMMIISSTWTASSQSKCVLKVKHFDSKTGKVIIGGLQCASTVYLAYTKDNWTTKDGWANITPTFTPGVDSMEFKIPDSLRMYSGCVCEDFSGSLSCFGWDKENKEIAKCNFDLQGITNKGKDQYCDNFRATYDGKNIIVSGLRNYSINNWIGITTDEWKSVKDVTPNLHQCSSQDTYYIPVPEGQKPGVICMFAHARMTDECAKTFDLSENTLFTHYEKVTIFKHLAENNQNILIKSFNAKFDDQTTISLYKPDGTKIPFAQRRSTNEGIKIILDSTTVKPGIYALRISSPNMVSTNRICIQ